MDPKVAAPDASSPRSPACPAGPAEAGATRREFLSAALRL
jgi:hypothetical protein